MISRHHAINIVSKRGTGEVCVWCKKSDSNNGHSNAVKQQQLFNNYFLFIVVQNDVRFCCTVLTGDINPIWLGQMFRVKSKDISQR